MKKYIRPLVLLAAYLAALRLCPGVARWMLEHICVPAMALLHRLTARLSFPVIEPVGLALVGFMLAGLLRACSGRGVEPFRRWLRSLVTALLVLAAALALLWGPAWAAPVPDVPRPDARRLLGLCEGLIDRLNGSPLSFPDPAESLAWAPAAAGMDGCAVKAARYPEWMALAGAWGAFVPLTGEALVDAGEPAPLLPFTAVHELAHLAGIADEGAANVAAWDRCMEAGGVFADSARLWALRYAMGRLQGQDEGAWLAARRRMGSALLDTFLDCGGEAVGRTGRFSLATGDYAALAGHLVEQEE